MRDYRYRRNIFNYLDVNHHSFQPIELFAGKNNSVLL
jgi:hypothetical protein